MKDGTKLMNFSIKYLKKIIKKKKAILEIV
jgi:hypothetical protein